MAIGIFLFWENPVKRRQLIIALGVGTIAFLLINELFCKHILIDVTGIRPRPYIAHAELITPIGKQLVDSSFPSSHMAGTALIMTLLIRELPLLRPVAILFTFLMAFSRMHNGMHYPTDVLAGTLLGIGYGLLGIWAGKKTYKLPLPNPPLKQGREHPSK